MIKYLDLERYTIYEKSHEISKQEQCRVKRIFWFILVGRSVTAYIKQGLDEHFRSNFYKYTFEFGVYVQPNSLQTIEKHRPYSIFMCKTYIYERSTRVSNIKFSILYDTVPKDLRVCAGITVNTPGLCIILEHHVNPTYEEHGGSCYTKLEG